MLNIPVFASRKRLFASESKSQPKMKSKEGLVRIEPLKIRHDITEYSLIDKFIYYDFGSFFLSLFALIINQKFTLISLALCMIWVH